MAHFAQIDDTNTVSQVIVVNNSVLVETKPIYVNGNMYTNAESESKGIEFCKSMFGDDTRWVQTSYNGNFRGKFASIGDVYDPETNLFYTPTDNNAVVSPQEEVLTPPVTATPSADLAALDSAQIEVLTTQQISGLE